MRFKQLRSYAGREMQGMYDKVQLEEAELYAWSKQKKPGIIKKFLMYTTLAAVLFGGSMAVGLIKTEDVRDIYNNIRAVVTGQENPAPNTKTIDNKFEGGN